MMVFLISERRIMAVTFRSDIHSVHTMGCQMHTLPRIAFRQRGLLISMRVDKYVQQQWNEDAQSKSTLRYLNIDHCKVGSLEVDKSFMIHVCYERLRLRI